MDPLVVGAIVIFIAIVFLFSGMPIAFALGVTSYGGDGPLHGREPDFRCSGDGL